uniref:Uncharacterized protein n=1 Tax=Siphoviridae sp. ctgN495 TaxID=2825608 RepID=A0A8S5UCU1_9CAUD|nr:MAG TPA: hypothetical protein [Siphoviridae sp. ctgN495]
MLSQFNTRLNFISLFEYYLIFFYKEVMYL